jgi:hypothetical protein
LLSAIGTRLVSGYVEDDMTLQAVYGVVAKATAPPDSPRKMVLADACGILSSVGSGAPGKVLDPFDEHAASRISVSRRT